MLPVKIYIVVPAATVVACTLNPAKDLGTILVDDAGCAYVYTPLREVNYRHKQFQNYFWPKQANEQNNGSTSDTPDYDLASSMQDNDPKANLTSTAPIDEVLHDGHDEGWEPYLHAGEQLLHTVAAVTQAAKTLEPYADPLIDIAIYVIPPVGLSLKFIQEVCHYLEPAAEMATGIAETVHHAREAGFMGHKHSNTSLHNNQFQHLINRTQDCRNIVDDILDEIRRSGNKVSASKKDKLHELKKNLGAIRVILNASIDHTDPSYSDGLLKQLDFSDRRLNTKLPFTASISGYLDKIEARLSLDAHKYGLNIPAISALKCAKASNDDLKTFLQKPSPSDGLASVIISPDEAIKPSLPPIATVGVVKTESPLSGKIIPVVGDGNCLFGSIIEGLRRTPKFVNAYDDVGSLRAFVARCISEADDGDIIANHGTSFGVDREDILLTLKAEKQQYIKDGKPIPAGMHGNELLTKEDYVRYIQTDRAWASTIEIRFIAQHLNIHITTVDQAGREIVETHRPETDTPPRAHIYVLHNQNHYDAFIPSPQTPTRSQAMNFSELKRVPIDAALNVEQEKTYDKKTTDCRAELNQLVPFKHAWAWEQYLSVGSTAGASRFGIFGHVDVGKTTTPERIRELLDRLHRVGEVHEGESTTDLMCQDSTKPTFGLISLPK